MRYFEITNERTGETFKVSGRTIQDCARKAAQVIKSKGWALDDNYHSERDTPPKWTLEWLWQTLKAKK